MKFEATLRQFGFKKIEEQDNGNTLCYQVGIWPDNYRYAEITDYGDAVNCWVVGQDIKYITMSTPGGRTFFEVKELKQYLSQLPKIILQSVGGSTIGVPHKLK